MSWVCSENGTDFGTGNLVEEHETKEQAIAHARDEAVEWGQSHFYVGRKVAPQDYTRDITCDYLLEAMTEMAEDDVGYERGCEYLSDVHRDHREELNNDLRKLVSAWMEKHGYEPTFYKVVDIEKVEVEPCGNGCGRAATPTTQGLCYDCYVKHRW